MLCRWYCVRIPQKTWIIYKCIVPSRHWDTQNSRLAASLLVRLVEREEKWESPDTPEGVLSHIWGGIEPNGAVTCMVLKATDNGRRIYSHDDFRGS
ncbi:hypothetical protein TNCV_3485271 [Trichonephila clavipes]|nr:hypothetical protein TNCV_3485271 [Trichonephila clavipes]